MRKKNVFLIFIVAIMLVLFIILPGYCETVDNTFEQLKLELKKEGVSDEFIKTTEKPVKRMISSAVLIVDIKSVLLDLWGEGRKGIALKNAVASVAELVESGDNTLEAAKITSGAAHKAESEGLSWFGVGMLFKRAVQDRKAYLKTLKN